MHQRSGVARSVTSCPLGWGLAQCYCKRLPLVTIPTRYGWLLAFGFISSTVGWAQAGPIPDQIDFNRDVRRLLSNTCFKCHGPDTAANPSELRLDIRELATKPRTTKSGRTITAIVPGKPEESEMWLRLTSSDPVKVMPPPDALHQVTPRDRAIIKRWIEQGAEYQPHWAYIPPRQTPPPAVKQADQVRNPVDNFIFRQLEARTLSPQPAADRATLLRRVSLDLIGLPPTPEELAAFLADERPDAYERIVDRLLASPHYGERMAVPWLDLVRYADSVGFHGDQRQNIFPYRDYVVAAFNQNKPYDQFVREQLAGDLLPDPTPEQIVATGFNRLNLMTREGGAQPKEYLAKYAADRVRAVSTAFMGSTVGCAECHDHKYDPFTARDFYALAAYFDDVKQWGVYSDYDYTPNPELQGFNNDFPFPPEIEVDSPYLKQRLARLRADWASRESVVVDAILANPPQREAVEAWTRSHADVLNPTAQGWRVARPILATPGEKTRPEILADNSVRLTTDDTVERPDRFKDSLMFTLVVARGTVSTVRFEVLPDPQHGNTVTRNESGAFAVDFAVKLQRAGEKTPTVLPMAGGFPDRDTWNFDNAYLVTTLDEEWKSNPAYAESLQETVWQLESPVVLGEGDHLFATVASKDVGRVRFSVSPVGLRLGGETLPSELFAATSTLIADEALSETQWRALARAYASSGAEFAGAHYAASLAQLREIAACREGRAFTMVTEATDPGITRILPRGNWLDESGPVVQPAPPRFLAGEAPAKDHRATRLDLADWLVAPENPLTARAFVNRLWNQFFGTGLSAVVDDLGLQGEYPSHPALLDWLAVQLVDSQWDMKAMVRLMVTSATYRQQSDFRDDLQEIDPTNRLWATHSPRRLEAEFVRDNALYAAGLLNLEIGGPSATPYQPEGYYVSLNFPRREYEAATDDRQYRRGLYTHWQRTFPHPMMANFDAPSREECTADRSVSNTPQQALTLLNDPTFVEAARALAERAMSEAPTDDFEARADYAFRLVVARSPTTEELAGLRDFHRTQRANYAKAPEDADRLARVGRHVTAAHLDPIELAAWTQVSRVLLNLNETLTRY